MFIRMKKILVFYDVETKFEKRNQVGKGECNFCVFVYYLKTWVLALECR